MPVDFNNLAPSCAQAVDQLSASRKQVVQIHFDDKFVETALVQDCCRFAANCPFLRVLEQRLFSPAAS